MKKILISASIFALSLTANAQGQFISDTNYRNTVENIFKERVKTVGKTFYNTQKENLTADEQEALKFLYAYMPLADVTDYPTSFFADNVRMSFKARKEMPWGKNVPELLFRHFVVPIRVNNEALDNARSVFYNELKDRIKGMSMMDAIIEVNHWCHEKVTYQPSDARTSAPLATLKTATGRCGEESTFAVAALRAVGIPARQVYTPRWAHTDDNHAWVEAWADGKWYFLGACEPEPVLNLGWFNAPASRAMLMHTRAFGDYNGPEEVMLRTSNFTEINLTSNYAPVAPIDFYVKDSEGKPVENARVEFKIYNYAEFFTAVTKYTDANGHTSLSAGIGDLVVWASKDGKYTYQKVSFGKDKETILTLPGDAPTSSVGALETSAPPKCTYLDIVPPKEDPQLPYVSDEMHKENQRRFALEDSIRKAYTATFPTMEEAKRINERGAEYIFKSRGNKQTIVDFIKRHSDNEDRVMGILATLSDKDLRDITTEILEDSYNATTDQLSPRVEDELITIPFKQYFEKAFSKKAADAFRADPMKLVEWIKKNIRLNPDKKALRIAQTPVGVMKSKITDERSRDIFFVDVARSLGIEAQKDAVTGKIQYKKNGEWQDVKFDNTAEKTSTAAALGTIVLAYEPTKLLDNPKYYSHFTISRIENGTAQLLNFDEGQADMGNGTTWSNTFKNGYKLDAGTYMLTTGTRLANGSVLASNRIFEIKKGQTTTLPLEIRQNTNEVSVIGSFNSESLVTKDGKEVSLLSQTGRGYYVVGILGVGQEPTNHALHDIEKMKEAFEAWGRPVVLLFESEADAAKFNHDEFPGLPSTVQFALDKDGSVRKQIAREMKLMNEKQMPMFIIADTFNRVVFVSQGYTIGLGEQMQGVFKKL
ncbi:MAG: transglutaminase domain-containing protein [Prevotella sp.]|uniref:transglutaminase-like domain-containing protein n=1 Tax=Leyella stercorea TaxID=363265 RepID=UPI002803228C|nr:transglutaminase domain-containing protein [Prevotella sp.]MDD7719885.1 transglutaminase domain-containing protein [Leyella stercorea]MDY3703834.1 transglutaminase domain-containing protein [Prevotella sp.]MDY3945152.1 transglutaminase domain-containing protein [Prevotella sp.]MDY4197860.1 transglutaminase domain-containing protein [Prevotella sp.]